jgi:Rad3-related DNA helicase
MREHFPHEEFRPGQEGAISEAIDAIEAGVENVIVEGATGAGKTPIAITVARYMTSMYRHVRDGVDYMLLSKDAAVRADAFEELAGHQAHLITNMKSLQRQYLQDDRSITLMMGKGNYDCEKRSQARLLSCRDSQLIYSSACDKCTYKDARFEAQAARLTLHNFDSFFNQASLGLAFGPRKLICIDEAHDLEEKVISAVSFGIDDATIKRMFPDIDWAFSDMNEEQAIEKMSGISAMFEKRKVELSAELDNLRDRFGARPMDEVSQQRAKTLSQNEQFCEETIRKTKRFLDTSENIDWAVEKQGDGFSFEPVSGRLFAHHAILKFGEHRLFLSATFLDPGSFCNSIKIKFSESKYISVPCTFPVKNRLIIPVPVGKMGQRDLDANWPKAVTAINKLCGLHKGVRGVIHATSYKLASMLRDDGRLSHDVKRRLVFHESKKRDDVIHGFMHESDPDAIRVGVSITQGYDFKGDMCRFQILSRIPYPYPSKRVNMRKQIDPRYYDWRTALTLVQTYGRGTRSMDDRCTTYILDSRLDRFVTTNRGILPGWFLEAILRR